MTKLENLWLDLMARVQAGTITLAEANRQYHEAKVKEES